MTQQINPTYLSENAQVNLSCMSICILEHPKYTVDSGEADPLPYLFQLLAPANLEDFKHGRTWQHRWAMCHYGNELINKKKLPFYNFCSSPDKKVCYNIQPPKGRV